MPSFENLKNTDIDVAVNAIIGSMLKNGYISELQNSILVSVKNDNSVKGKELEARITKEINDLLVSSKIYGIFAIKLLYSFIASNPSLLVSISWIDGKK